MTLLKGVLKNAFGEVMPDHTILFTALKSTQTVMNTVISEIVTGANGEYEKNIYQGKYQIDIFKDGVQKTTVGVIEIFADSPDADINTYLTLPGESEVTPEFIQQVIELKNQAIQASDSAVLAKNAAQDSATAAAGSATDAAASKAAVAQSASDAAASASDSAASKTAAAASAKASADSATAAAGSATDAANKATTAANSATAADTSAGNAATSATAAAGSKDAAAASASQAKGYADALDPSTVVRKTDLAAATGLSMIGEFSSFAKLRLATPAYEGQKVSLAGWSEGSQKGGGVFVGHLTAKADNGGTIASNGGSYYWERVNFGQLNPFHFGAAGDGVRDDVDAIKKAALESFNVNRSFYLPDGDFFCSTSIELDISTIENFRMTGSGSAFSRLIFAGTGYGVRVYRTAYSEWDYGAVQFRGMSIMTTGVAVGEAICIDQSQITGIPAGSIIVEDLQIRGKNTHTQQWLTGVRMKRTTGTTMRDVEVWGYANSGKGQGIAFEGATNDIVTQHIIDNCRFWFLNETIHADAYIQGIFFVNSNVFNCNYGLTWDASSEANGQTELHIVNSQFTVNVNALNLTRIGYITMNSTMFISNQGSGSLTMLRFDSCVTLSFMNSNITGLTSTNNIGISWENTKPSSTTTQANYPSIISNVTFDALDVGIYIGANANGLKMYHNVYSASVKTRVKNDSGLNQCREDTVFRKNDSISLSGTTALQQFAVSVTPGIFSAAPTMAELHWLGDYVLSATYNQATSTATSLVFNVRRFDGAAVSGGPYAYAVRATE